MRLILLLLVLHLLATLVVTHLPRQLIRIQTIQLRVLHALLIAVLVILLHLHLAGRSLHAVAELLVVLLLVVQAVV